MTVVPRRTRGEAEEVDDDDVSSSSPLGSAERLKKVPVCLLCGENAVKGESGVDTRLGDVIAFSSLVGVKPNQGIQYDFGYPEP